MTGWNLPPGVTTNMLPGNTPADEEMERVLDELVPIAREVLAEVLNTNFSATLTEMGIDLIWNSESEVLDCLLNEFKLKEEE